jgi:preprotein translocase subunit SecA
VSERRARLPSAGRGRGEVLRWCRGVVAEVAAREPDMRARSDAELRGVTATLRGRVAGGAPLEDVLAEAFAAVREAAARAIGDRPFDVQVMGAGVLHLGQVAEMRTGEGKTLTAVMPAYLHALSGSPVHVLTANEFLARRDAEWMGPVYRFLGLTTGLVLPEDARAATERRAAYQADVTYGAWHQFGLDYLRDNQVTDARDGVQRGHGLAIVDEADLVMIDYARVPLVVSSGVADPGSWPRDMTRLAARLRRAAGGTGDYEVDERTRTVSLLGTGVARAEDWLGIDDLYAGANIRLARLLSSVLAARELYLRDRDYLVADGRLVQIDQLSGRPGPGSQFETDLQQALEAKEGLPVSRSRVKMAEILEQEYLHLYQRLAAMTGTAAGESGAYRAVYGLDVVTIPANRPAIRIDHLDLTYADARAKLTAVADAAQERHAAGQPVLIGTVSVAQSVAVSELLNGRGIAHEVLSARNQEREAEILAEAGRRGAVTVVTQMAGRGVDIRLGGADGAARDEVAELGGLCVLGAERQASRRLDEHLRGRAGRQGDPGESRFYLSLDDDLLMRVLKATPRSTKVLRWLTKGTAGSEGKLSDWSVRDYQARLAAAATASLVQALEYDVVLAGQRHRIYAGRRAVLLGDGLRDQVRRMIDTVIRERVTAAPSPDDPGLWRALRDLYPVSVTPGGLAAERACAPAGLPAEFVIERVSADARAAYRRREAEVGAGLMPAREASVILAVTDQQWREHLLRMAALRSHASFLGGRSPLGWYQREAGRACTELRQAIGQHSAARLFGLETDPQPDAAARPLPRSGRYQFPGPAGPGPGPDSG